MYGNLWRYVRNTAKCWRYLIKKWISNAVIGVCTFHPAKTVSALYTCVYGLFLHTIHKTKSYRNQYEIDIASPFRIIYSRHAIMIGKYYRHDERRTRTFKSATHTAVHQFITMELNNISYTKRFFHLRFRTREIAVALESPVLYI